VRCYDFFGNDVLREFEIEWFTRGWCVAFWGLNLLYGGEQVTVVSSSSSSWGFSACAPRYPSRSQSLSESLDIGSFEDDDSGGGELGVVPIAPAPPNP